MASDLFHLRVLFSWDCCQANCIIFWRCIQRIRRKMWMASIGNRLDQNLGYRTSVRFAYFSYLFYTPPLDFVFFDGVENSCQIYFLVITFFFNPFLFCSLFRQLFISVVLFLTFGERFGQVSLWYQDRISFFPSLAFVEQWNIFYLLVLGPGVRWLFVFLPIFSHNLAIVPTNFSPVALFFDWGALIFFCRRFYFFRELLI